MSLALALFKGAAIGFAVGTMVFAVVIVAGIAGTETGLVVIGGALAAALGAGLKGSSPRAETMGASLIGLAAVIAGVVTGFGVLEASVITGSVISALWTVTGRPWPRDPWAWLRWGLLMILVLVIVLLPLIVDGGTLGHDESAYALKARQWLEDTPGSGWSPHRGTGMSGFGYLVLAVGGDEAALRSIGLLGAGALASGAWLLGRRMASPRAGGLAAIGAVAGPAVFHRGTEYLSDLPAAALLIVAAAIVWRQMEEKERLDYGLLWFLAPALAAFYLRYQSALSLGLIVLIAIVLWWPKVRSRPGPFVWVGLIGLLGLAPHVAQSVDLTGTPWGILLNTGTGAVRAYVGEGLADYASQLLWPLGGYALPIALIAAIAGLIGWWRSSAMRRCLLFLVAPALVQVLALGLISHGEPRFVFFPVALVAVAGSITVDRHLSGSARSWVRAVAVGLLVLVIGSLALSASYARTVVDNRRENNEPVELAALEVAGLAGETSCGVLTSYTPQITFYSRCASEVFPVGIEPGEVLEDLPGETRFMVIIEGGKRQPTGEELDELVALTDGSPLIVTGVKREGTVYRFPDQ